MRPYQVFCVLAFVATIGACKGALSRKLEPRSERPLRTDTEQDSQFVSDDQKARGE